MTRDFEAKIVFILKRSILNWGTHSNIPAPAGGGILLCKPLSRADLLLCPRSVEATRNGHEDVDPGPPRCASDWQQQ